MTIQEILHKSYLEYRIHPFDAGILLSLATNMSKEYILAHPENNLTSAQIKKYVSFVKRRLNGELVAYIAGKKEFFGLDFIVNKNVLIPRPETELLVEHAIGRILNTKHDILDATIDVGTGSGNIIVSIAKNIPNKIRNKTSFYAVDLSKESLRVAKANAKRYKLDKKIKFIQSNLLEHFQSRDEENIQFKNILIIANLPYVSSEIYKKNKNNLKHEPKQALISNNRGLNHCTRLIREISEINKKCCIPRIICYMEISPEQKLEIDRIIKKYLPKSKTKFFKDLAGKWRMAEIKI